MGQRVEAGSFCTRCVRGGCRDRSPLVRERALAEGAALALAQGWCGRWFGECVRVSVSMGIVSVREREFECGCVGVWVRECVRVRACVRHSNREHISFPPASSRSIAYTNTHTV